MTSVISSTNSFFPGQIQKGNILSFTGDLSQDPILTTVIDVSSTSVTVTGVTTVNGVASGAIPTSATTLSDLKVLGGNLEYLKMALYTQRCQRETSQV